MLCRNKRKTKTEEIEISVSDSEEVEVLEYETRQRKMVLDYIKKYNVPVSQEVFNIYYNEYVEFLIKHNFALLSLVQKYFDTSKEYIDYSLKYEMHVLCVTYYDDEKVVD